MKNLNRFAQYKKTFETLRDTTLKEDNSFRAQAVGKKIKISAGFNKGSYALSIISADHKINLKNTELIKVERVNYNKDRVATIFLLQDDQLLSIFISFAIDLEDLLNKDNNISINEIYNRYLFWQRMFKVEKKEMSEMLIKGLVNELNILDELMIPKYGVDEAIRGWMGLEKNHKDFTYSDSTWYEAKAINIGKLTVKISSLEQLLSIHTGYVLVSELEKTSPEDSNGINIFKKFNVIKEKINDENTYIDFLGKINILGFPPTVITDPNHEINNYRYVIHKTSSYLVDKTFPVLKQDELPIAIGAVSYELILTEIEDHLVNFD